MKLTNLKNTEFPITMPVFFATLVIGVGAGLSGMLLVYLLHFIQHIAYGYSLHSIISSERFLAGVTAASSQRRVIVLTLCGLIAGGGWWAIYRFGKPLVGIPEAVKTDPSRMPRLTTILHALLQMITVAMGSPLGREVAPREVAAVFASWFSLKMGLTLSDAKVMTACGAGAGLAAVYNVPLGGALFTLEVLLRNFNGSVVLLAIISSTIAVVISRLGLGDVSQYEIHFLTINSSLVLWSVVTAPIFGVTAYWFSRGASYMGRRVQHNWQVPFYCLLNFFMIGLLAIYFPAIIGNGISAAQVEFSNALGIELSAILLILRIFITLTSIRAGAHGGLLTPSVANGALLAVVLGCVWRLLGSDTDLSAFAIVGAAAFLAVAQKMPLTAIILIFEFTRVDFSFMLPVLCAVIGAVAVSRLCAYLETSH
ncbi:MAG: chloride channel protein [Pseudomonadota bacterium]